LLGDFGLADAGRAAEQEGADRLVRIAEARAGHLDGLASASMAASWPKTTFFRSRSRVFSAARSSLETLRGGMRAILATISSISVLPMSFFWRDLGRMRWAAPASSITSMALSGRWRSLM
jgi:hypothetical protein